MTTDDWRRIIIMIILAVILVVGIAGGGTALLFWLAAERRTSPQATFDAWFAEHQKTCKQCYTSMNENPDEPICEEAFAKLQESLKK